MPGLDITTTMIERATHASLRASPQALADAASDYAALGYRPCPIGPVHGEHQPLVKFAKHPEILDGITPRAAAALMQSYRRADRIGLVMGGSVFALDLDVGHANAVNGIETFAQLVREHGGDFPKRGPRQRSPRGGLHILLSGPSDVRIACAGYTIGRAESGATIKAAGVDCKGANGVLTCAPSMRPDGAYSWLPGHPLCHVRDLPPAPEWLIDAVCAREEAATLTAELSPPLIPCPTETPPHNETAQERRERLNREREEKRRRAYIAAAVMGAMQSVQRAQPGERNRTLFIAAARLSGYANGNGSAYLSEAHAAAELLKAAKAGSLVQTDGIKATEQTIASGIAKGRNKPRDIPPPDSNETQRDRQRFADDLSRDDAR